jgi:cytochrome c-type biogenesis protein CcmH
MQVKPVFQLKHCALLLILCVARMAQAVDSTPPFDDPQMQARYLKWTHELRCVQCVNEAIADSPAGVAADLRRQVHEMLAAGKTDDQIREYLVARYGEFVLYKPSFAPRNWLVWAAPVIFLVVGLVIAGRVIVRKSKMPIDESSESTEPTDGTA